MKVSQSSDSSFLNCNYAVYIGKICGSTT